MISFDDIIHEDMDHANEDEQEEYHDAPLSEEKKDRYVGDIDPVTGLRHGTGKYKYTNPYFTFEGQYENGRKNGYGKLMFSDGGYYEGDFKDNQICGYGTRLWADGTTYTGNWNMGEKHGEGTLERPNGEGYSGDWVMNIRHGGGKWTKANKEVIEGEFVKNYPQGQCNIRLSNGDLYRGNVDKGIINGKGEYRYTSMKMRYEGDFVNGKRDGNGVYTESASASSSSKNVEAEGEGDLLIPDGLYHYKGEFKDDFPVIMPNQLIFYTEVKEEEPADPKKKDPKKAEPEVDDNPNKLIFEIGKSEPISFEIRAVFQGEPYEDDTPPDEEELKKQAAKKSKPGEEAEPRMITPSPVIITQESGRKLILSMGRAELAPLPDGVEEEPPEEEREKVFKQYKVDQREDSIEVVKFTQQGVAKLEGITYELREQFKAGKYEITIRDVTDWVDRLGEVKINLEIINPEEPPVPVKGKKK